MVLKLNTHFFYNLISRATCLCIAWLVSIICVVTNPAHAQDEPGTPWRGTTPEGEFLGDSIKIGLPIKYSLSLRHPADMEVIFPDSTFDFSPFVWLKKEYFPTRTDEAGSLDSVVYTLTTFTIDSIQRLSLPIFIIHTQDCTAVYTAEDSVMLKQLITQATDTLQPKINTTYQPVPLSFNYPNLLLILGSVCIVGLSIYALFGERIKRAYTLYRMGREHASFSNTFERLVKRIGQNDGVDHVENAVILWKNYMESLEDKPFSTYTTKEIIAVIPNQQLAEALQDTDRIIYGQITSAEPVRSTRVLASVARRSYIEKKSSIERKS